MIEWDDKLPTMTAEEARHHLLTGTVNWVTDGEYLYGARDIKRLDGNVWYAVVAFKTFYGEPVRFIGGDKWDKEMKGKVFQRWDLMNAYEAQEALANGWCIRNVEGDYLFLREITDPLGRTEYWVFSLNPDKEGLELVCYLDSFTYGENAGKDQYYLYDEAENDIPRRKTKGRKAVGK